MTVSLDLSDEVLARLQAEASARHTSVEDVVSDMASRLPTPATPTGRRRLAFAAIGESASGKFARDADEMLAEDFGRD